MKTYVRSIIADNIELSLKRSFQGKWYQAVRIAEEV